MTIFKMTILRGSMRGPNRENIRPFYIVRVRGLKHAHPGPAFLACCALMTRLHLATPRFMAHKAPWSKEEEEEELYFSQSASMHR
jgi:hypothetical protein